mmetsp:Transcript_27311/g.46200  ORF Transcript_27311/g.46200 Transcript_27311/m.46200 type:complete len:156 (-) Transcript_27311:854-1321(-)
MRKSICTLLLVSIGDSKGFQFGSTHGGNHLIRRQSIGTSHNPLFAKPKSGSVVDSYQTVSVNCICRHRLFRYKKKNGTKSNLIKCYVERIVHNEEQSDDSEADTLQQQLSRFEELSANDHHWLCPNCGKNFARSALIHGRPALKLVGGKTRMTKK